MRRRFIPNTPYSTAIMLMRPTYSTVKGVEVKTFENAGIINVSFKAFGGTEQMTNDLYEVIDTAYVETWYRPDITSDCRIRVMQTGRTYDILGEVENIDMRNQYAKFKVRAVKGGA